MENKQAAAPGVLNKSTANIYALEEKLRNMEKEIETYKARIADIEDTLMRQYGDSTEEYELVPIKVTTGSFSADNPPRANLTAAQVAMWKIWTNHCDLYCDEVIKDL